MQIKTVLKRIGLVALVFTLVFSLSGREVAYAVTFSNAAGTANDASSATIAQAITLDAAVKGAAICVYDADGTTHDSVDVGGSAATKIIEAAEAGDIRVSAWYIANPPTGAITVTATYGAAVTRRRIGVMSHTDSGAAVTPGSSSNGGSSSSVSLDLTTTEANSLIFDCFGNGGASPAGYTFSGTNQTERFDVNSVNPRGLGGSTQTTTTAGTYTGVVGQTTSSWAYVRFEVKEAAAVAAGEEFLLVF